MEVFCCIGAKHHGVELIAVGERNGIQLVASVGTGGAWCREEACERKKEGPREGARSRRKQTDDLKRERLKPAHRAHFPSLFVYYLGEGAIPKSS